MHPFCCAAPVPVSPAAGASSAFPQDQMHPPPPPPPPPPVSYDHPLHHSSSARCTRSAPVASPPHSATGASSACANGFRWPSRPALSIDFSSMCTSLNDATELRLDDIMGNGIAGILHKWVNYGRGWRPRWFVLQDGVLSYYKIHGPDRIQLSEETDKGSKVIGEDSLRRLTRHRRSESNSLQRKAIGEVHLKVATIRDSRSDDRRFSIFTGTKMLRLRAETRDDRAAWMEALQAVKEMFPRISNSELMAPVQNLVVSTEKLRQRMQEDEVSEVAIQDSEQIMRSEFWALHGQLAILKQKQLLLIDTLRQLETEKVDLENMLVSESQRQSKEDASALIARNDKCSG